MIRMLIPFDYDSGSDVARRTVPIRSLPGEPHVVFVDNGKLGAADVLRATGDALVEQGVIKSFTMFEKTTTAPLNHAERAKVMEQADLVVSGVGDCGGCSSMVTIDALNFLEIGVPAAVVATRPFTYLVDATDRQHGLAGLWRMFLDHPIWAHETEWYETNGARLADELKTLIRSTDNTASVPAGVHSDIDTSAFEELRTMLAADDFGLEINHKAERYIFRIVSGPGSCSDCLVPKAVFADIIVKAGRRAGLSIDPSVLTIDYPTDHLVT